MEKASYIRTFCIVLLLCLVPVSVAAFNSAAHVYIADRVYPNTGYKIDFRYGSAAPDVSLYVADPSRWPSAFEDTHYDLTDLLPYAWNARHRAFARGWFTHGEMGGADYFAHIEYPAGSGLPGYVIQKAGILEAQLGLDPEFGHFAVETAIDLLLKADDPALGGKLLEAVLFRSWQDRQFMVSVFVWREHVTDWLTLFSSEWAFRDLLGQYAAAYVLPPPLDQVALADLGSRLALDIYGIEVSPLEVYVLLNYAVELCEGDYKEFVNETISQVTSVAP